jgi:hypothetical protein
MPVFLLPLPSVISPNVSHWPDRQPTLHSSVLLFRIKQHTHTHMHTSIHSHSITHMHSHLPEPRTRTDKREKLTPYARFQSVCRPSLREASDRMIIAVRLFVDLFVTYTFSRPSHLFVRSLVRPYSTRNRRNTCIAF